MRRRESPLLDSVFQAASDGAASVRGYLASEEGRRLRGNMAKLVIVGAPLITRLPVVRRYPALWLLRAAGVAAVLVKGAEWLRDWEPN